MGKTYNNQSIQILIMTIFGIGGVLVAITLKSEGWTSYLWILIGLLSGVGCSVGYFDKKHKILLWGIIGACLGFLSALISGQKEDLITMPLIFAFTGTLIGHQVYESPRKIKIGALIGALFLGAMVITGTELTFGDIGIKNSLMAIAVGITLGA